MKEQCHDRVREETRSKVTRKWNVEKRPSDWSVWSRLPNWLCSILAPLYTLYKTTFKSKEFSNYLFIKVKKYPKGNIQPKRNTNCWHWRGSRRIVMVASFATVTWVVTQCFSPRVAWQPYCMRRRRPGAVRGVKIFIGIFFERFGPSASSVNKTVPYR